ncbi:MFS transporter [Mesoterricola sediminis]|uniref:Sugar transporter n=1 Tax=Mesoterricola sediminis TaxID=2927980 RepID=A0AA48H499_9BACT|nr:MFS transporter [Mesoterricola sediminis]BDU75718.1 sugar transporter [Mesoterricola sediminis]
MTEPAPSLSRPLTLTLAAATGLAVASIYYAQPLLPTIAGVFGLAPARAGLLVTTAQVGYALGLAGIVPLGDRFERRGLIVAMTLLAALGLVLTALAPAYPVLVLGMALTGLFSVVTQILVPFAATLATPEARGRVVGTVMSGLLLGILLARTVAGAMASLAGWRSVFWAGAAALALMALVLRRVLPRHHAPVDLSYPQLLASILTLFREEPLLRRRAFFGACAFANFSVFWTSMAFLLAGPPHRLAPAAIGLMGLAGAAGALAASMAGRMADAGRGARATQLGLGLMFASWIPLALGARSMTAFLIGVLLLDFAVQGIHISNQTALYQIRPEARNRLTAGYMTAYFAGGALGSLLSASAYGRFGWNGVVGIGLLVSAAGVAGILPWRGKKAALPEGAGT